MSLSFLPDQLPRLDDANAFSRLPFSHAMSGTPSLNSQATPDWREQTTHPIDLFRTFHALGAGGAAYTVSPSPSMADEVAFLCGVDTSGAVVATSYGTWHGDSPATYASTSQTAKWGTGTSGSPGGTVYYYFDPASNWQPVEISSLSTGLTLWSDLANIQFVPTTDAGAADIKFVRGTDGGAYCGASWLQSGGTIGGTSVDTFLSATISIDTSVFGFGPIDGDFSNADGYVWMTLLHEEGHALGLGHGGPYNGSVDASTQQFSAYDNRLWTIMSYIGPGDANAKYFDQYAVTGTSLRSHPTTPMALDILAIQQLYGASTSPTLAGGQTFGFNCNITDAARAFFDFTVNQTPTVTLWDSGTGNALDLSGFSTNSTIDLNPGTFSSCAGSINNLFIAFDTSIDTAIGGAGDDTFQANDHGDKLVGRAGNDLFSGNIGNDTLNGGNGSDTAWYGSQVPRIVANLTMGTATGFGIGSDTLIGIENLVGGARNDKLTGDANANMLVGGAGDDKLAGGNGKDLLISGGGRDKLVGGVGNDVLTAAENFSATQTFDHAGLPYDLLNFGGPTAQVMAGGATGDFLRLAYASAGSTNNVAAFPSVAASPLQDITITFDFDMSGGAGRADGMGMALLPTSLYPDSASIPAFAEEPNLAGALGVGFDIFDNGGETDNEVSLHFNGVQIASVHVSKSQLDLAGGEVVHASLLAVRTVGGSLVTLTLTPDGGAPQAIFQNVFVSGFEPSASTLAFGAQTGGYAADQDIDNVHVVGNYNLAGMGDLGSALFGGSGADTLIGGSGNDRLTGGTKGDTMDGGAGADIFVYGAASDSTSKSYDTLKNVNFDVDRFDLAARVKHIDAAVGHGTLSAQGFDATLAAAVDAAHLKAHHAVLFTPDAGSFDGDTFLVVDLNGVAGYQAGEDLVMLLSGSIRGSLDVHDFI